MKIIYPISLLAVLLFSSGSFGQTVSIAKIKFKGIGLESTYAQVVKALGKPANETAEKKEECLGGREKSVGYAGVSLYLMDGTSSDGETFEVKSFEVTTSRYVVSGVKVGDTTASVRAKFGRKYTVDTDRAAGTTTWLYAMNERDGPGTTRVVFKNGKVTMIASDYQVC